MIKIRRTGAEDYSKYVKVLLCGNPGAGKTLFSSLLPNPIIASAEGGLMSIADKDIPYIEIKSIKDLLHLKTMLDQPRATREELMGFPVDSVVIDTIDEIQKILIKERLAATQKDAVQLQDWGWLLEQMRGIIKGFRNLDMHTLFTCHLKEVSDNDSGKTWNAPALQGAIANELPGYVDLSLLVSSGLVTEIVDNQAAKVEKRFLSTRPSPLYPFLKDRSGKLPAEFPLTFEDDFKRIHDIIFANVGQLHNHGVVEIDESQFMPPTLAPVATPKQVAKEVTTKAPAKRVARPVPVAQANPAPSRPVERPVAPVEAVEAPKAPERSGFTYKDADGNEVKSQNELPDGVIPTPKGYNVNAYCTECGNEVETQDMADLSRIRWRNVLCTEHHKNRK